LLSLLRSDMTAGPSPTGYNAWTNPLVEPERRKKAAAAHAATTAAATSVFFMLISKGMSLVRHVGSKSSGGIGAESVLYNFAEAELIDITAMPFAGTLFAPSAHVAFSNGNLDGHLVARSVSGDVELHHVPFAGVLAVETVCNSSPVPDVPAVPARFLP
jgi:hypothetical protein